MKYYHKFRLVKDVIEDYNPIKQNPDSIKDEIRKDIGYDINIREYFVVYFLDCKLRIIGKNILSIGSETVTVISIKQLVTYALLSGALSVIIGHNHPSGDTTPSETDKKTTQEIKKALKLLDIGLTDHIIVTKDSALSFIEEDLL
jgi:DNA repair protein RadC